jgi:hypothetical protein
METVMDKALQDTINKASALPVALITDGASNMVAMRNLLAPKYPNVCSISKMYSGFSIILYTAADVQLPMPLSSLTLWRRIP